ncbi:MAG TPA: lyase family protein [Polyangiaceae bacterium]|jgi:3-carboxy-cis,cis-muconate cycloisomerase|nr:lyase family protein [Polyangiaceae bacterium]
MSTLPDFDPGFSTPAMGELWSSGTRIRRWCDAEAALARATASAGLIPRQSAALIERACASLEVDAAALLAAGWTAGTPIVTLLEQLRPSLPEAARAHLHFGATSQDIVDTGTALQLRDAFGELTRLLASTADGLAALIEKHPRDVVVGRTLMQPAVPMRFAWRVACWLDPLLDVLDAIAATVARVPVQLGGPVGDLTAFGDAAPRVVEAFASDLGLAVPAVTWHTSRGPIVESTTLAVRVAGVAEKIASDLVLLSQREIAEIALPSGGSSSMPHKKNAFVAIRAVAAARACRGVASTVVFASPHELERAAGSFQAEWFAVPLAFQTAGAAAEATRHAVTHLTFDAKRALENLEGATLLEPTGADRLVARVVERHRRSREARR